VKYAVISDVHANLAALQNVLADAKAQGVEKVVCLGDVVGYGPLPAETVALARKECFMVLAGNHDDAVSGRGDASTFVDLAKEAVARHRAALSEDDLAWLRSLPYTCTLDKAVAAHGDVFDPPKFYYILDENGAEANFAKTDARLVFVGHTHEPAIFLTGRSGAVYKTAPQDFTIEDHKRYIVNPGSVGYPRESSGKCFSSYVLYDSVERTVTFRYLPFQVSSVMQRGEVKKPLGKRFVAAIAAGVALIVAIVVWALVPKTIEVVDDPALVVAEKSIPIDPDLRHVSANIALAKGSDPVQLRIVFESPSGEIVGMESLTVKQSSRKGVRIPEGTARARFTALKARSEDAPDIQFFAPAASVK
jgi:predicted phosphodiesterase